MPVSEGRYFENLPVAAQSIYLFSESSKRDEEHKETGQFNKDGMPVSAETAMVHTEKKMEIRAEVKPDIIDSAVRPKKGVVMPSIPRLLVVGACGDFLNVCTNLNS